MDRTRVLIADDNAGFGNVLSRFVASHSDLEVVGIAADGRQAVLMAGIFQPDFVLMDMYMPEVDGLEATRRLKASDAPPYVFILTAHKSEESRSAAQAAGADAFFFKNEVDSGLVDTISGLMRRDRTPGLGADEGSVHEA
jgi:DNA-binding NarL/FixJ family response regulator